MGEFFYDIVLETIMTIMEIIQKRKVDIPVNTLMDNDTVLFAFYKTLLHTEPISSYSVK